MYKIDFIPKFSVYSFLDSSPEFMRVHSICFICIVCNVLSLLATTTPLPHRRCLCAFGFFCCSHRWGVRDDFLLHMCEHLMWIHLQKRQFFADVADGVTFSYHRKKWKKVSEKKTVQYIYILCNLNYNFLIYPKFVGKTMKRRYGSFFLLKFEEMFHWFFLLIVCLN